MGYVLLILPIGLGMEPHRVCAQSILFLCMSSCIQAQYNKISFIATWDLVTLKKPLIYNFSSIIVGFYFKFHYKVI